MLKYGKLVLHILIKYYDKPESIEEMFFDDRGMFEFEKEMKIKCDMI